MNLKFAFLYESEKSETGEEELLIEGEYEFGEDDFFDYSEGIGYSVTSDRFSISRVVIARTEQELTEESIEPEVLERIYWRAEETAYQTND